MRRLLAVAATLAALCAAGLATTPTHAATMQRHDPCFFTDTEWDNWYGGDRWGASLSKVEDTIANCTGTWSDATGTLDCGDWNGHNEHCRVWAMKDGSQVWITFAHYDTAPTWRAHDWGSEHRYDPSGGPATYVCEWPRPSGNPCP